MAIPDRIICSSHTVSGVMPGDPAVTRHRFEDRVAACARAGYRGMCLHFRDYRQLRAAGYDDAQLGDILRGSGMTDFSLEFLTDWFLTGTEAQEARENEAAIRAAARAYGAHSFNIGTDFLGRDIAPAVMRAKLSELCDRAGDHGLTVALEIVPWSNVPDVESALFLTDGIANAGLVVDAWHVFRGGIPLADLDMIPAGQILSIQVNDADAELQGSLAEDTMRRKPCGEGVFDLDGLVARLDRAGASVPLSVEIISPEFAALDLETACERSIVGARHLMQTLRSA